MVFPSVDLEKTNRVDMDAFSDSTLVYISWST